MDANSLEQDNVESAEVIGSAANAVFGDLGEIVKSLHDRLVAAGLHVIMMRGVQPMESGDDGLDADELVQLVKTSGSRFAWLGCSISPVSNMMVESQYASRTIEMLRHYEAEVQTLVVEWLEGGTRLRFRIVADWVKELGGFPTDVIELIDEVEGEAYARDLGDHRTLKAALHARGLELAQWLESQPEYRGSRVGRKAVAHRLLETQLTEADQEYSGRLYAQAIDKAASLWQDGQSNAFNDCTAEVAGELLATDSAWSKATSKKSRLAVLKRAMTEWSRGYVPTNDLVERLFLELSSAEPAKGMDA